MNFTTLKHFTIYGNGDNLTSDLLKNLWRKVCVKVHPDKGGSHEAYLEAQNEYETLLKFVKAGFTAKEDSPEAYNDFTEFLANISPFVRDVVKAVGAIEDIKLIEITGYWVWVTLDRTQVAQRNELKDIKVDGKKFTWHRKHVKWVWKGIPASGRVKMDWEQKKSYWGYDSYKKEEEKQVTT